MPEIRFVEAASPQGGDNKPVVVIIGEQRTVIRWRDLQMAAEIFRPKIATLENVDLEAAQRGAWHLGPDGKTYFSYTKNL